MKPVMLKSDEIVVSQIDFGYLVTSFIRDALRPRSRFNVEWLDKSLRKWWPLMDEYEQRQSMTAIEVAIELNKPPRYNREPLDNPEFWIQFVKEFRPPPSTFTVDYTCNKCKKGGLKLWRGVHGSPDENGNKLLCAACLAPDLKVNEQGRAKDPTDFFPDETDQIKGWLPACPVDDTFWGYSSIPSQDVEWWLALPTYKK